jgi:hypothetical protein
LAKVLVSAYVYEKEALWIYGGPADDVRAIKEKIELQPFVEAGLLTIVEIASGLEAELRVTFEAALDPGESITGAIAVNRNWALVIDEKKARHLFNPEASHIQLIYALDLVKYWVDRHSPPAATISAVLRDIRYRALYEPGPTHPLNPWWVKYWLP